ncbi:MAG: phosphatidylglycerol lysyltransferase domain-containing protein, partial [Solirubrobacteraceae bacterium]
MATVGHLVTGATLAATRAHPAATGARLVFVLTGVALVLSMVMLRRLPRRAADVDRHSEHDLRAARAIVERHGHDSISPFILRPDKSFQFADGAVLAYRVIGETAIVSGDPVGPDESVALVLGAFLALARARRWRVVLWGTSARHLARYRSLGLGTLCVGEEAVVHPAGFTLEGRPVRKLRQSVHRLERGGFTAEILYPREIGPELRAELEGIARSWRGVAPERGFVMALDALFRLEDDALFVLGRGPDRTPRGFLHLAVCSGGRTLSLSSMPRLRDTPNGFNEWLVCEAVAWAKLNGFTRLSLNFAPFAALLAPDARLSGLQRAERRALLALKGHFQ